VSIKIEQENILAVEGKDERNFFEVMLGFVGIGSVQVIDVGGKDNFKNRLSGLIQSEGALEKIKKMGFVRDAEKLEADSSFQSICGVLKKYDLPCPSEICKPFESDGKRVGIFIMPDNRNCGMLEDLCIESIKDTPFFSCIESFINCCKNQDKDIMPNTAKVTVLAYLSTRDGIPSSLGIAARQNVWDFSKPCFNGIKQFLKDLFV